MALQRQHNYISPEQYLEIERAAEFRSEYISGEMIAMSAPSKVHGQIVANMTAQLHSALRGRTCEVNVGVSVATTAAYLVPDVVIYCDGGDFTGENDILQNPVVIVEVLSKSTGYFDRGVKWIRYQQIPSLMHYVLISQDEPRIEVYSREPDGGWHYHVASGLEGTVSLPSVHIEIALSEIYDRVTFEA